MDSSENLIATIEGQAAVIRGLQSDLSQAMDMLAKEREALAAARSTRTQTLGGMATFQTEVRDAFRELLDGGWLDLDEVNDILLKRLGLEPLAFLWTIWAVDEDDHKVFEVTDFASGSDEPGDALDAFRQLPLFARRQS